MTGWSDPVRLALEPFTVFYLTNAAAFKQSHILTRLSEHLEPMAPTLATSECPLPNVEPTSGSDAPWADDDGAAESACSASRRSTS